MPTTSEIKAAAQAMRKSMLDGRKLSPVAFWTAIAEVGLKAAEAERESGKSSLQRAIDSGSSDDM